MDSKDLLLVRKPSRYINREPNTLYRSAADFRLALAFPDTYEMGMSHIGMKILYGLVNRMSGFAAERCFAPWQDMEALLRHRGEPLTSLETGRPLGKFDAVGFSLQYELGYTNVLSMLALAGIPVLREERSGTDPVILAGGPCTVNPAPMSPFIDAFLVGDGEEAVPEILGCLAALRDRPHHVRVSALAGLSGVYVPASAVLYEAQPVNRRIVDDLEEAFFPTNPVVAHDAVHNRVAIEIGRGCPRGCRYCQAGMIYRPLRERSLGRVLDLAEESIRQTGFSDLSFTSLSAGDYPCLFPLIRGANRRFKGQHVAVSLPSVRVGSLDRATLHELRSERKTGFTIAPEAGSDRLRAVINKDIREEAYLEGLHALFQEGWESVKLYFMIGLPTETEEDIEGIARMARMPLKAARSERVRRVNVNVSVSTFVPKPHTPFQWHGQISLAEINRRQTELRNRLRSRQIRFKAHSPEMSVLEAVFCRGDERAARLLLAAYQKGCRFDGWTDAFRFDLWQAAMDESGVGLELAQAIYDTDARLPWQMVDSGIRAAFLKKEWERSLKAEMTPECRERCTGCGLGCEEPPGLNPEIGPSEPEAAPRVLSRPKLLPQSVAFRVRHRKTGPARFLSHLEMKEAIVRGLRRIGLSLEYSQGFHPHPRLSFGPALGVGLSGSDEYFDVHVLSPVVPEQVPTLLNPCLPEGLEILQVKPILKKAVSLNGFISRYEYRTPLPPGLLSPDGTLPDSMIFTRTTEFGAGRSVDLRPLIDHVRVEDEMLVVTAQDRGELKVRIHELLASLTGTTPQDLPPLEIERTRQEGFLNGWVSPMDVIA